jgi:hypothetical protein
MPAERHILSNEPMDLIVVSDILKLYFELMTFAMSTLNVFWGSLVLELSIAHNGYLVANGLNFICSLGDQENTLVYEQMS